MEWVYMALLIGAGLLGYGLAIRRPPPPDPHAGYRAYQRRKEDQ